MFFLTPILSVALLAALTAAAPATLEERQGGAFVAIPLPLPSETPFSAMATFVSRSIASEPVPRL
jgi:hypothetical protein